MALGSKRSSVKPKIVKSQFSGIDNFIVDLDGLAQGNAQRGGDGRALVTQSQLASPLQTLRDLSVSGLGNQLRSINLSPEAQYAQLSQGINPFYNLADEANRHETLEAITGAQARFSGNGLENSTVRGAYEAQLANDAILRDLTARNDAINLQNDQARRNTASLQSIFSDLASLQQAPAQLANNNLFEAFGQVDKINNANAQRAQQAELFNAQQQNQAAQSATDFRRRYATQVIPKVATTAASFISPAAGIATRALGGLLGNASGGRRQYARPLPQVTGFKNFLGKFIQ